MNEISEHEPEEDDVTEETEELRFTFPQGKVRPLYSRFRSSEGSRSARRTQLKPLKPISFEKEDSVDAGYLSGNAQNPIHSEVRNHSSSGDFFHVNRDSRDGITSIKNNAIERKFPLDRNNKGISEENIPLLSKLRTPFSNGSAISLVKRIPKNPLTPGFRIAADPEVCNKDPKESKIFNDCGQIMNEKKDGIDSKHSRVLKNVINQNYNPKKMQESDKLYQDVIPAISDIKLVVKTDNYLEDKNLCNMKSPKNKAPTTVVRNKNIDYDANPLHYRSENFRDKHVSSQKPKSQKSLFSTKEEGNLSENKHNLRFCSGIESNILYVNNIQYSVLSKLGQGGSSQVFLVLDKRSSLLAIKCVKLVDADEVTASGYLKEIEILSNLQKSNRVIKLIDNEYDSEQQMLYVVMEKGDTDLSTLLKQISKTGDVSLPMVIYYWTEILQAVKEIHAYGIVHADLKPANFLLVSGRLKLIDFGIASAIQNDATSVYKSSMHGTCNYMSPEAVQDPGDSSRTKVGYKSDVWSLGCILYNLLYRKTPFQHIVNNIKKLQVIASCNHHIEFPPIDKCPPPLMEAMKRCLNFNAKKRPSVEELLSINYIWATDKMP